MLPPTPPVALARPPRRAPTGVHGRRQGGGRGGVGAIARAVGRGCSRPGCPTPAAATLVFSYADRTARLVAMLDDPDPQAYDLCGPHAGRTRPPSGWDLADDRPALAPGPPVDLDDEDGTVRLLARALHGEPTGGTAERGHPASDVDREAFDDPDEDPLRAALEEVQRVVATDPVDEPASPPPPPPAPPTPLRRRRVVIVDVDDPNAEPTLW